MELQNNKTGRPLEHYTALYRELDPVKASERCGIGFDGERFTVCFFGYDIFVSWPEFSLAPVSDSCPKSFTEDYAGILILRFILDGMRAGECTDFLSYREFPWGSVYDGNFQGRCIKRLAFSFGKKPDAFRAVGEKLGGIPLGKGDGSFEFSVFPNYRLHIILYAADDEFPPSSQFVFSANLANSFTAEDLAVIGDLIINALKEMSKKTEGY